MDFSDFVAKIMDLAKTRYEFQKKNPRIVLNKTEAIPAPLREYNSKLCICLIPAIPEKIKQRVMEGVEDTMHLSSVTILDEVWHYVAPGGQEELEGVTKFVRGPGTTSAAEEARS